MLKSSCYCLAAAVLLTLFSVKDLRGLQHEYQPQDKVLYGNPDMEVRQYQRPNENTQEAQPPASNSVVPCDSPKSVSGNLGSELSKFKKVRMPFRTVGLTPRERRMVLKLVEASQYLESIYWRQSDPEGLELYEHLASCVDIQSKKVRRYLMINGSRYDLLDGNKPFADGGVFPPGRALYPPAITKAAIDAYVASHPEKKTEIYHPFTVVKNPHTALLAFPHHQDNHPRLTPP